MISLMACDCLQIADGVVVNSKTGKPITKAKVVNKAKPHQFDYTNMDGKFRITSVSRGFLRCPSMKIEVSKDSFKTMTLILNSKASDRIELISEPIEYDDAACISNQDSLEGMQVYTLTERQPKFGKGDIDLLKYISYNFEFNVKMNSEEQTRAFCSFVIDTFGFVRNACIYKTYQKGIISDFELEALRVVRSLPAWQSGESNGLKVPVRIKLPIAFILR